MALNHARMPVPPRPRVAPIEILGVLPRRGKRGFPLLAVVRRCQITAHSLGSPFLEWNPRGRVNLLPWQEEETAFPLPASNPFLKGTRPIDGQTVRT